MTLLAFAADRRAAVDMDRKAAAPAADTPCSSRSISSACGTHSSKPAARRGCGARWDRETDRRTDTVTLPRSMQAVSINGRRGGTCSIYLSSYNLHVRSKVIGVPAPLQNAECYRDGRRVLSPYLRIYVRQQARSPCFLFPHDSN